MRYSRCAAVPHSHSVHLCSYEMISYGCLPTDVNQNSQLGYCSVTSHAHSEWMRPPATVSVVAWFVCLSVRHNRKPYKYTHTHPFNGPLSRTTQVSHYQKGKTNLDFTEEGDSEWQWHQLGRMQVCNSLQTDNHTSTPPLSFYRPDALPAAQPTASTTNSVKAATAAEVRRVGR